MATNLTITLDDQPGELARLGEATGNAGVNILGIVGTASGGRGEIHVLVEDAGAARSALEGAGFTIDREQEMVVIDCEDSPGELGRVARKIADGGANINLAYMATGTRLAFGSDDMEALRGAL